MTLSLSLSPFVAVSQVELRHLHCHIEAPAEIFALVPDIPEDGVAIYLRRPRRKGYLRNVENPIAWWHSATTQQQMACYFDTAKFRAPCFDTKNFTASVAIPVPKTLTPSNAKFFLRTRHGGQILYSFTQL